MTADLTIVGLGFGAPEHRTLRVQRILDDARIIHARGFMDPALADLAGHPRVSNTLDRAGSTDDGSPNWERAAEIIVADIEENGPAVMVVQGHPRFGEPFAFVTESLARSHGLTVEFVEGMSIVDVMAIALDFDVLQHSVQIVSASHLIPGRSGCFSSKTVRLNPGMSTIVTFLFDDKVYRELGQVLLQSYPANHGVRIVANAGSQDQSIVETTIGDLVNREPNYSETLFIPERTADTGDVPLADITIVGLGSGPRDARTERAQRALDNALRLFVRSHGNDIDVSDLLGRPDAIDLAPLRDSETYPNHPWTVAENAVLKAASAGPVTLAIPGHPRFGEGLVVNVVARACGHGLSVDVIDGISTIDLLATALNIDPIRDRVQLFDGRELSTVASEHSYPGGMFTGTPRQPMLITHVYDELILRGIHTTLARIYPPDHPVTRIEAAGQRQESIQEHTLADLPALGGGGLVALYIPAREKLDATRSPATLQHIVARLRRPDGCPWDRKQTNASLASSLVDEVYEVVDAINASDDGNLCEELGDLLLLLMMHSQIAEERGAFTLEDVYDGIATKIVRRHPHVFGDLSADAAGDVVGIWQDIKRQEKAGRDSSPEKAPDGHPHSMPALERAARVLRAHPLDSTKPRTNALLSAINDCVVAGNDPETELKDALFEHVRTMSDTDERI